MPAPPPSDTNLLQAVRSHFGLRLGQLAGLLDVSPSLLGMAATGRRELPTTAYLRLRPLAVALPPPWSTGAAHPAPAPALLPALAGPLAYPPEAATLQARLHTCRHLARRLARRLARELAPQQQRQAQATRLLAVLPALAAAHPPATDARAARWLPRLEAQARERLGPGPSAALALAQARRQGLLAEAAQLAAWLGEG